MDITHLKYDCKYFKGDIPCIPNKLRGKICDSCDEYEKYNSELTNKRILIIKLGAIGDVIRTTPLLIKFKKLFPDSYICWITHTPEVLPKGFIDNILKPDYDALLFIQNSSFDIAVNLDKEKEACFLLKNADAKQKFGFSWSDENHIIGLSEAANQKILTGMFDSYSKENTKSYQQEIFEICGFKFNNEPNLLEINQEYSKKWEALKTKSGGKTIIGLNTGCGKRWITRMWPQTSWNSLIKMLQKADFYPVLLGGSDEHRQNLKYSSDTGVYYPGFFSLNEFIGIVNNCDIIITGVSMAMHIASGLGKPIVLFNNIFNKNEFELYGKGIIIEPSSGCDCYYGEKCTRKNHCMNDIETKTVFNAVINLNGGN